MRICAGITHVVIGEAPDMSFVVEEVRHRWNSLSIDTSRREDLAKTHPLWVRSGAAVASLSSKKEPKPTHTGAKILNLGQDTRAGKDTHRWPITKPGAVQFIGSNFM